MKKTYIILTLLLLATAVFAAPPHSHRFMWTMPRGGGPFDFRTLGYSATWNAPEVLGSGLVDADVTWTKVSDNTTTQALKPSMSFFSATGDYTVEVTDWSKVTSMRFDVNGSFLDYIAEDFTEKASSLVSMAFMFNDNPSMTNYYLDPTLLTDTLTSLEGAYEDCNSIEGRLPDISGCTNLTTIRQAFNDNRAATGQLPELSALTKITDARLAFLDCHSVTGSMPSVAALTNLTTLNRTFEDCEDVTGTIPSFGTGLVRVTSLFSTYKDNPKLTGSIPSFDSMTNLTTISSAFMNNTGLTGSIPSFDSLDELDGMSLAFRDCEGLTGNIPSFNSLTKATKMAQAFQGCTGLTGSIPSFDHLEYLETMYATFRDCPSLSGDIPVFTNLVRIESIRQAFLNSTGLTGNATALFANSAQWSNLVDSREAFSGMTGLTGNGMDFVNAPKAAGYVVGTGTTDDSYRTFYGCTNLTDWASIPAAYK